MVLISSTTFGQWELARINDRDGYTNVRSNPSAESEIAGTFKENQFFECQPSPNQWLKVRGYYGLTGYIHKSRITFIIDLPDSSQIKLVNDAIEGLTKYRKQYYAGKSVLSQEGRMELLRELESFEEDVYSPLLDIIKVQFCKNSDIDLLNRFISIIIENQMSANEMPSWTLGGCFICHPNIVLQQIKLLNTENKEYLIKSLEFGFENVVDSYNPEKIEQIKELRQMIKNEKARL